MTTIINNLPLSTFTIHIYTCRINLNSVMNTHIHLKYFISTYLTTEVIIYWNVYIKCRSQYIFTLLKHN